ncbi:MAG: hypothetical protein LBI67_11990 [Treponema sp.]|jgi:hypothetical protein|nr:hypothetical protein [Treponema sp.]
MKAVTQVFYGTSKEWLEAEHPLYKGVWGVETRPDGKRIIKIGDGRRTWAFLPPIIDGDSQLGDLTNLINKMGDTVLSVEDLVFEAKKDLDETKRILQNIGDFEAALNGKVNSRTIVLSALVIGNVMDGIEFDVNRALEYAPDYDLDDALTLINGTFAISGSNLGGTAHFNITHSYLDTTVHIITDGVINGEAVNGEGRYRFPGTGIVLKDESNPDAFKQDLYFLTYKNIDQIFGYTGYLVNLATRDKSTLVAAINENSKIDGNDAVLARTRDGIRAHINLVHNAQTGELKLTGKNDAVIATVNIAAAGILQSAAYDDASKILTFTWATDPPTETQVDLSDLIAEYTAGDGIDLTGGVFSVKIDGNSTGGVVSVSADGLKIDLSEYQKKLYGSGFVKQTGDETVYDDSEYLTTEAAGADFARKAATLAGYGITDAFPKRSYETVSDLDALLESGFYTVGDYGAAGLPKNNNTDNRFVSLLLEHIQGKDDGAAKQILMPSTGASGYPLVAPEFFRYKINGAWRMWESAVKDFAFPVSAVFTAGQNYLQVMNLFISASAFHYPVMVSFDAYIGFPFGNYDMTSFKIRCDILMPIKSNIDTDEITPIVSARITGGNARYIGSGLTSFKIGARNYEYSIGGLIVPVFYSFILSNAFAPSYGYPLLNIENIKIKSFAAYTSMSGATEINQHISLIEIPLETGGKPLNPYGESENVLSE